MNESELHAILANVQDALIATDPDGGVIYMNDAARHLYGYEELADAELESRNMQRYALDTFEVRSHTGDPVPNDDRPLLRALRGESFENVELLVRHREKDETRAFVYSGRVLSGASTRVLTIRDETDRWRAERRYRTVFETDPAPSLIARLEDEQILQVNTGLLEMLGSDKSDIIGKNLLELEMLAQNGDLAMSLDALRDGERIHKQKTTISHPDNGKPMSVLVSARAIELDREPCAIFTFSDVTELERSQQEHTGAQKELAHARSRLAEQREQERAIIARDLHDGVVQDLLALSTDLANEERTFHQRDNVEAAEANHRNRQRVLDAAVKLRRTIRGLRPPALREEGLWATLEEVVSDLRRPGDPEVVLPHADNPELSEEKLLVLYRVAREAIHNALKHANASEVQITFHTTESDAIMQVQDDGDGFQAPNQLSSLERDNHFGLLGMDERIAAQNGTLEIESTPGEGTTIRCRIPLDTRPRR